MPTGTVKWFDERKGYGFIVPDGGGQEVFVRCTAIRPPASTPARLAEGQAVEFEVESSPAGLRAVSVRPADHHRV